MHLVRILRVSYDVSLRNLAPTLLIDRLYRLIIVLYQDNRAYSRAIRATVMGVDTTIQNKSHGLTKLRHYQAPGSNSWIKSQNFNTYCALLYVIGLELKYPLSENRVVCGTGHYKGKHIETESALYVSKPPLPGPFDHALLSGAKIELITK